MNGEINYNELILEELQTQTEVLQELSDSNTRAENLFTNTLELLLPLVFIYIIFGLFLKR